MEAEFSHGYQIGSQERNEKVSELKDLLDEYDSLSGKVEQVGRQAALLAWRRSKKGGGKETQAEIAKDVGRHQTAISRWCRVGQLIDEGSDRTFKELYESTQHRSRSLSSELSQKSTTPESPALVGDSPVTSPARAIQPSVESPKAEPPVLQNASPEDRAMVQDLIERSRLYGPKSAKLPSEMTESDHWQETLRLLDLARSNMSRFLSQVKQHPVDPLSGNFELLRSRVEHVSTVITAVLNIFDNHATVDWDAEFQKLEIEGV